MAEPANLINNYQRININYDFKLEFQQFKAYYNFRYYLKKKLKEVNIYKYENEQYYLVDKKWLKYWKTNIGYFNICQEMIKNESYDREIYDSDYNKIFPLLKIFCTEPIYPLDNSDIYFNGEINPISDFVIADKKCFAHFIYPITLNKNFEGFPIMFFHGNFLLKFNPIQFLLSIKLLVRDKEDYCELILNLIENVYEEDIINLFTGLDDIANWLRKYDFDLNLTEGKEISFFEHKIKFFNKTLLINKQKKLFSAINPQLNLMEIKNVNNNYISEEDIHEKEMKQTQIINKKDSFVDKEVDNTDLTMIAKKVQQKNLSNYPEIVSLESTERIINQMKKNIVKIYLNNESKGTGFFCKIPFINNKELKVLITNNHVINLEMEKIAISINNNRNKRNRIKK